MSAVLGRLEKNAAEELRVSLEVSQLGRDYIDIRVWRSPEAGRPGAEVETERGFRLEADRLGELIEVLSRVDEALRARRGKP